MRWDVPRREPYRRRSKLCQPLDRMLSNGQYSDMLSKLTAIQTEQGLTDAEMAGRLGIGRSTWTEVRNGRLPISERVQMRAAKAFPELLGDLLMQVSNPAHTPKRAA